MQEVTKGAGRVQHVSLTGERVQIKLTVDRAIYDAVQTYAEVDGTSAANFFVQGAMGRLRVRYRLEFEPSKKKSKTKTNSGAASIERSRPPSATLGAAAAPAIQEQEVRLYMEKLAVGRELALHYITQHVVEHGEEPVGRCPGCVANGVHPVGASL